MQLWSEHYVWEGIADADEVVAFLQLLIRELRRVARRGCGFAPLRVFGVTCSGG